ncbi:hypothetical protein [Streptomyces chattanoogensis]|uniref:hypothetical protein n=1 Tax=Streptomyces chattanoogensis TaxID=66876 RepID=UPI00369A7FA6
MSRPLTALVVVEMRIALRSPLLWLLTLLTVTGRTVSTWHEMPNWSVETVDTATSALVIGAGAMLAANLAILRDRRADAVELTDPLPVRKRTRTLAVLVAHPLVAMVYAAMAMGAQMAGLRINSHPVGHFDIRELLAGVLLVALMTALGAALGRWIPSLFAAPVCILLFFWTLVQFPQSWLLPMVPSLKLAIDPVRPPTWHLVYVAALALGVGTAALLRHGRHLGLVIPSVGSAAAVVVAITLTLNSPAATDAARTEDLRQSSRSVSTGADHCEKLQSTRYCAFPSYAGWIPLWRDAVGPVVAAVPTAFRHRLPGITQRTGTGTFDPKVTSRNILTNTSWGRNGAERDSRRALAGQMAAAATGFPWGTQRGAGPSGCDARGRARTVVALWLIGQTEKPLPATTTRSSVSTDDGKRSDRETPASDLGAVDYGSLELAYAQRLLAQPGARERIWANWSVLIAPTTTIDQALPLLDLKRAAAPEAPKGTSCE